MNWEDILWELVQKIESVAPKAWELAVKQVQVMYYQSLVFGILFTISGLFITIYSLIKHAKNSKNNNYYGGWLFGLFGFVPIIIGFLLISDMIAYGINPEYYAIKSLVDLVSICN